MVQHRTASPGPWHGHRPGPARRLAAVFARRPGGFVWIIDLADGRIIRKTPAAAGRRFYGHGVFTADGRLLCSENAFDSGEGVIGVYDSLNDYRRTQEFSSHGVGPHEIRLCRDGQSLAVANGGIRTHPDLPRVKMNLASMQANLSVLSGDSGELLRQYQPPDKWHQLSIRHIAVSPNDEIAIAMQYEGRPYHSPPLVALAGTDGTLKLLRAPAPVQGRLRNYCGSIEYNRDGSRFAVSSPRGGVVTYWSAHGDYLGLHEQPDACGLSRLGTGDGFLVSDGLGGMRTVNERLKSNVYLHSDSRHWDNHMMPIV